MGKIRLPRFLPSLSLVTMMLTTIHVRMTFKFISGPGLPSQPKMPPTPCIQTQSQGLPSEPHQLAPFIREHHQVFHPVSKAATKESSFVSPRGENTCSTLTKGSVKESVEKKLTKGVYAYLGESLILPLKEILK